MMADREKDLEAAIDAVRAASSICRAVQQRLVTADTLEKKDKSPVTVADFASQAVVCEVLQTRFPDDPVVGEEGSADLQGDSVAALRGSIVEAVADELGYEPEEHEVLAWIDRGDATADTARYWTIDPIDGTKGFLRGEQYAVALGLIENGEVVLGVLGCPNLPGPSGTGVLFSGVLGAAAQVHEIDGEGMAGTPIAVAAPASLAEARFCESVESGHSDQGASAKIAAELGIATEPFRIDSQCKYAAVARGDASIYLRLPTRADYEEKIWDHAAGMAVVEAAGGRVSDITGQPLDFRQGCTLKANKGIIATSGDIHDPVVTAVQKVLGVG
ncbi:MAG: 3'(2'),5'-bisphosphate nucleotidase [bacterium]